MWIWKQQHSCNHETLNCASEQRCNHPNMESWADHLLNLSRVLQSIKIKHGPRTQIKYGRGKWIEKAGTINRINGSINGSRAKHISSTNMLLINQSRAWHSRSTQINSCAAIKSIKLGRATKWIYLQGQAQSRNRSKNNARANHQTEHHGSSMI